MGVLVPGWRKESARGSKGGRVGERWMPGGDGSVVVVLVPGGRKGGARGSRGERE